MPSNQNSVGSSYFSDVCDQIITRLRAGAPGSTATNTRIVVIPDAEQIGTEYLGVPGYLLRVNPPEPVAMSGAGRHGYVCNRRVDVIVVTSSHLDPGGRDDGAARQHLNRQDAVINVLNLWPPADSTYGTPIGRQIKFVPGGMDITRRLKTNPGMLASALCFDVFYTPPQTVYRDP